MPLSGRRRHYISTLNQRKSPTSIRLSMRIGDSSGCPLPGRMPASCSCKHISHSQRQNVRNRSITPGLSASPSSAGGPGNRTDCNRRFCQPSTLRVGVAVGGGESDDDSIPSFHRLSVHAKQLKYAEISVVTSSPASTELFIVDGRTELVQRHGHTAPSALTLPP